MSAPGTPGIALAGAAAAALEGAAVQLGDVRTALAGGLVTTTWEAPGGDRFRDGALGRLAALDRAAEDLRLLAGDIRDLRDQAVRLVARLQRIEHAVTGFFHGVVSAADGAGHTLAVGVRAIGHVLTLQPVEAARDVAGAGQHLLTGWLWHPGNLPPSGDLRWLDVHDYLMGKGLPWVP